MRFEPTTKTLTDDDLYRIITQKFISDLYDFGVIEIPTGPVEGSDAEQHEREVAEASRKFAAFHRLASVHGLRTSSVRSYALTRPEAEELRNLAAKLKDCLALSDPFAAHQFLLYRLLMERVKQLT